MKKSLLDKRKRWVQALAVVLIMIAAYFAAPKNLFGDILRSTGAPPKLEISSTGFTPGINNTLELSFEPNIQVSAASGSGIIIQGFRLNAVTQKDTDQPCTVSGTSFVCADITGNNPFNGVILEFAPSGTMPAVLTTEFTLVVDGTDENLPPNGLYLIYPEEPGSIAELNNPNNRVRIQISSLELLPTVSINRTTLHPGQKNILELSFEPDVAVIAAAASGLSFNGFRLSSVRQLESGQLCSSTQTSFVCADLSGQNPFTGVVLELDPIGSPREGRLTVNFALNIDSFNQSYPPNGLYLMYPAVPRNFGDLQSSSNRVSLRMNVSSDAVITQVVGDPAKGKQAVERSDEKPTRQEKDAPLTVVKGQGGSGGGGGGGGGGGFLGGITPSLPRTQTAQCSLSDVQSLEAELREAIQHLCGLGIIKGYPDGTFRASRNINRAEMAKILIEGFHKASLIQSVSSHPFPDVPSSEWFAGYVGTAKSLGVFEGYPDGSYKPANNITWAETVKVYVTGSAVQDLLSVYNTVKAEKPNDEWFIPYADAVQQFTAKSLRVSSWEAKITRGDAALWLSRILKQNAL